MSDEFKVVIHEMRYISHLISSETDTLKKQTDTQIGRVDETCKSLPPAVYSMAAPGFLVIKAFLGRSTDMRDRISTILSKTADLAEKTDQQLAGLFD